MRSVISKFCWWLALCVVGFTISVSQVSAATHPSLVVSDADRANIQARKQNISAVADAWQRMSAQSWMNGAPVAVQEAGWSRQLVELSFVGYVDRDANRTAQAKSILLDRTAGPNRYAFSDFNSNVNKYVFGQPCAALALGYDLLSPTLTEQEATQARELLTEWGSGLYSFYQNRGGSAGHNFHTSSIACLGLIGLALDGEVSAASQWRSWAEQEFRSNFVNKAYNLGGDYTEGYVYQQYGLPVAVLFLDALKRTTGRDLVAQSNLSQLWNFYLAAYGSDGGFPRYGDSADGPFLAGTDLFLLQRAQQQTLLPEYVWLWKRLRGSGASQSTLRNQITYLFKDFDHLGMVLYYPELGERAPTEEVLSPSQLLVNVSAGTTQGPTANPGGMAVLRSAWPTSLQSTSLWLNNRWRWQNHQHYDPNAFTLEGYGETLVSNFNDRFYDDPLKGKWSQQNTVRINPDGVGGDAPISAYGVGLSSSLGTFPLFFRSDIADVLVSDSRYSHANLHLHGLENGRFSLATPDNITPIAQAERTVVLVKELLPKPFYLMYDDFRKEGASEYVWQMYIPNRASGVAGVGSLAQPFTYTVGQAKLRLAFLNQLQPVAQLGAQETNREDKPVRLTIQAGQLQLLTALFPDQATGTNPQFRQVATDPAVYEVQYGDHLVQILFNPTGQLTVYEDVETDAVLAVGKNWASPERAIVFHRATFARFGGVDFFRSAERLTQVVPDGREPCSTSADFNADGKVNLLDVSLMLTQLSRGQLDEAYDLNCDEQISVTDVQVLFQKLGW